MTRAFHAGVVRQRAERRFDGALHDVDADLLVFVRALDGFNRRQAAEQRHAAAGHDAFLDRRAGRVQRVFDAGFLFLHFGLGRGADVDDGHATGELRQAFLQFLAVVIARWSPRSGGGSDSRGPGCRTILPPPSTMVVFSLSITMLLARPRSASSMLSSLMPRSSLMNLPPVRTAMSSQHGLAAVAEARGLHGADVERAAQLVHDQGRERFAFDFFGDDEQRLARACAAFSSNGSRSFRLLIFFS